MSFSASCFLTTTLVPVFLLFYHVPFSRTQILLILLFFCFQIAQLFSNHFHHFVLYFHITLFFALIILLLSPVKIFILQCYFVAFHNLIILYYLLYYIIILPTHSFFCARQLWLLLFKKRSTNLLHHFFFFFVLAMPTACGSSQVRDLTQATAIAATQAAALTLDP